MVGKEFLYDDEEWVVEEILLYGHRCVCRSYYSDRTSQFYCDFVNEKIMNYEEDLKEKSKNDNAIIFKEEDEKILLKKIICNRSNFELLKGNKNEINVLLKMIKKVK